VVELEDHNYPAVLTGSDLSYAAQRYADWATNFKSNPNVVFGTQNEPDLTSDWGAVDNESSTIYNAIRSTGNQNMVLVNPAGGWSTGGFSAGGSATGLNASVYANMTNIAWDLHYYNWLSGDSADLAANKSALTTLVSNVQWIKSAEGTIPVILGEYGPAYSDSVSPGGDQIVAIAQASGLGALAWAWETYNPVYAGDLVNPPWTGGPTSLTPYGKTVEQFIAGSSGPPPPVTPPPVTTGTGSDTLVLGISEDAYQGDAQFTVSVDGKQLGNTFTTTASHASAVSQSFTFNGDWTPGTHAVVVNFLNDAYGGTAATDRNLYVNSLNYDGSTTGQSAALMSAGPKTFSVSDTTAIPGTPPVTPPPVTTGTGSDALVFGISEDAYQGDAQFTVSVDGKQLGNTFTTTASHASAVSQSFTFNGDWAPGTHAVVVNFLNDAYGGTAATDRNLYVNSLSYDGKATGQSAALMGGGPRSFSVTDTTAVPTKGESATLAAAAPTTLAVSGEATPSVSETGDHGTLTKDLSQTGTYSVGSDTFVLSGGNAASVTLGTGASQIRFIGASSVTLVGGSGQANVTADGGSNTFVAGTGTLDVTGGTGKDAYVFHTNSGFLGIEDFSIAEGDTLTIDKALQGAFQQTPDGQGGTILAFGAGTTHGVDIHGMTIMPTTNIQWT